jgi:hypothetical protein
MSYASPECQINPANPIGKIAIENTSMAPVSFYTEVQNRQMHVVGASAAAAGSLRDAARATLGIVF